MIESLENALQIVILLFCSGVAVYRTIALKSRFWALLSLVFGSWVLGDLYWQVYLLYFGHVPQLSLVSDLSWDASYIFLFLLLRRIMDPEEPRMKGILPWLGPLFAAVMAVFFMQWGKYTANTVTAVLMGNLLYHVLRGLKYMRGRRRPGKAFYVTVLAFCLLEYCMWTASAFFEGDSLLNPYFWFDFLLSVCFLCFLPAARKAVAS